MHFLLLSVFVCSLSHLAAKEIPEIDLLRAAVDAFYAALQYMQDHAPKINLDGALGCKITGEILHAFLEARPDIFEGSRNDLRYHLETMRAKADRVVENAKPYLKVSQPQYFATLGGLLDDSKVPMWFPSRTTNPSLKVEPLSCDESVFNESLSDSCLQEILGSRPGDVSDCSITDGCLEMMTAPRQRGYMITHQVLFFQLLEWHNCLMNSQVKSIPQSFRDTLCSNVMRDAEEIASAGYPLDHHDLFMEQIGLCGMWGYSDFYKPEWLSTILGWQQKSGCYGDRAKWACTEDLSERRVRVKREEKLLEDGCLSHKTTVALVAIAANIRFLIEYVCGRQESFFISA